MIQLVQINYLTQLRKQMEDCIFLDPTYNPHKIHQSYNEFKKIDLNQIYNYLQLFVT